MCTRRSQLLSLVALLAAQGCRLGYEVMDELQTDSGSFGGAGAPAGLGGTEAVGASGDAGGTSNGDSGGAGASSSGDAGGTGSTNGSTGSGVGGGAASVGGSSASGSGGAIATAGTTGSGGSGSSGSTGSGASGSGGSAGSGASGTGGSAGSGAGGSGGCSITNSGVEACDGLDNDCNGMVDENNPCAADCFAAADSGQGYMFCATPLLWAEASAYCAASSMSLVRIDGPVENAWILSTAHSDPDIASSFAFFIGASDPVEGEWVWPDGEQFWTGNANGSPVGGLYSNWDRTDPNDQGAGGEDCGAMRADGSWNDVRCSGAGAEMPFACETP